MAGSQSSWGSYRFAEDKKDKCIFGLDFGEWLNTPWKAGNGVSANPHLPALLKGKIAVFRLI